MRSVCVRVCLSVCVCVSQWRRQSDVKSDGVKYLNIDPLIEILAQGGVAGGQAGSLWYTGRMRDVCVRVCV